MPEHVHLLVKPLQPDYRIADLLRAIKAPFAQEQIARLREASSPLLGAMRVVGPTGRLAHRCWQRGGGYDRNLYSTKAMWSTIDYFHQNPVRRGLVDQAIDFPFSSAMAYHLGRDESGLVELYSDFS